MFSSFDAFHKFLPIFCLMAVPFQFVHTSISLHCFIIPFLIEIWVFHYLIIFAPLEAKGEGILHIFNFITPTRSLGRKFKLKRNEEFYSHKKRSFFGWSGQWYSQFRLNRKQIIFFYISFLCFLKEKDRRSENGFR